MQQAHGSLGEHAAIPLSQNARPMYSSPPTPHDWARIQDTIFQYYVIDNLALHKVRENLQLIHGFKASERMIKARLNKWEYVKNAKREDWGYLAILHERRRKENKPATEFEIRGHRKTVKDLQRFIRNQNKSAADFLVGSYDFLRDRGSIPDYVRAYTPTADNDIFSPSTDAGPSENHSLSPEPSFSQRELASTFARNRRRETNLYAYFDPEEPGGDNFYNGSWNRALAPIRQSMELTPPLSERSMQDKLEDCYSERTRQDLEITSQQLLNPIPLEAQFSLDDFRRWSLISQQDSASGKQFLIQDDCPRCESSECSHLAQLDNVERQLGQRNILIDNEDFSHLYIPAARSEGAATWIALCFQACICLHQGIEAYANRVLKNAEIRFAELVRNKDKQLLTAAGIVMTCLHLHNQTDICYRIMQSAEKVVEAQLPKDDPIRVTICYLATTADTSKSKAKRPECTSETLARVYRKLEADYFQGHQPGHKALKHPYVIAAHYNYAWMLKFEGEDLVKAERHARESYKESVEVFTELHMQSMTALSVVAGCLAAQKGRRDECLATYESVIKLSTKSLGVIHPYTLELQRRVANVLEEVPGKMPIVWKLHKTILFGKATMLGKKHTFTLGQKDDCERILAKLGPHEHWAKERARIHDLFERGANDTWVYVPDSDDDYEMMDVSSDQCQQEGWIEKAKAEMQTRGSSPGSAMELEVSSW